MTKEEFKQLNKLQCKQYIYKAIRDEWEELCKKDKCK